MNRWQSAPQLHSDDFDEPFYRPDEDRFNHTAKSRLEPIPRVHRVASEASLDSDYFIKRNHAQTQRSREISNRQRRIEQKAAANKMSMACNILKRQVKMQYINDRKHARSQDMKQTVNLRKRQHQTRRKKLLHLANALTSVNKEKIQEYKKNTIKALNVVHSEHSRELQQKHERADMQRWYERQSPMERSLARSQSLSAPLINKNMDGSEAFESDSEGEGDVWAEMCQEFESYRSVHEDFSPPNNTLPPLGSPWRTGVIAGSSPPIIPGETPVIAVKMREYCKSATPHNARKHFGTHPLIRRAMQDGHIPPQRSYMPPFGSGSVRDPPIIDAVTRDHRG